MSYVPPTASSQGMVSSENMAEAGNFAKERASEFKSNLNEGSLSLRILALLAALAMIVVSVLGFLGNIITLHWVSAIFKFYTFVLGIVIIILEYGQKLSFLSRFERGIFKQAPFLKFVWGRGLLYVFAGTLVLSQDNLVTLIVGGFVCAVGVLYILVGRSAAKKLKELRRSSVTPEQMQEKFAIADVDGKGALTMNQFRGLTGELGMDLTKREVESVFFQLDCEQQGRVPYETILQWWNNEATDNDDFQTLQVTAI